MEENDLLTLYIKDDFFPAPAAAEPPDFFNASLNLDVIYEDPHILLVYKPPGLLCHSDGRHFGDTLVDRVRLYLYHRKAYLPAEENSFAPALCNRLDRNTEGLVLAAKDAASLRFFNEKLKTREVEKYYRCLVWGMPQPPQGLLTHYLIKDGDVNTVRVYNQEKKNSKQILTEYRRIPNPAIEKSGRCLLEIRLLTGRSHQIRAQLAHIGHPLCGDSKYGGGQGGYCLCAYQLVFSFSDPPDMFAYLNHQRFTLPLPSNLTDFTY